MKVTFSMFVRQSQLNEKAMNTATQIIATMKHWNSNPHQSVMRKTIMNNYKGVKEPSNQELRENAESLQSQIDRGLLDIAVYIEFVKLSVE